MPIRTCWLIMLFRSAISLLIFHPILLSVAEEGILTSPTINVNFSISDLSVFALCSLKLACLVYTHLGHYVFLVDWTFHQHAVSLFISTNFICCEIYFACVNIAIPAFFESWLHGISFSSLLFSTYAYCLIWIEFLWTAYSQTVHFYLLCQRLTFN